MSGYGDIFLKYARFYTRQDGESRPVDHLNPPASLKAPLRPLHAGPLLHERYFDDATMVHVQELLAGIPEMKAQRDTMLLAAKIRTGDHALDVGSGTGVFARDMSKVTGGTGAVVGVDRSEIMLETARAACPACIFLKGDATALPVESVSFDVVTASQVLCFLHDVKTAIAEMFRVLRPGGRLVILDSHWDSLVWNSSNPKLMKRAIDLLLEKYVDTRLPVRLSRYLADTGFTLIDRQVFNITNWEPAEDNYAAQTVGFIGPMMAASEAFDAADWKAWLDGLKSTAEAGEYLFSLNRYMFTATKP